MGLIECHLLITPTSQQLVPLQPTNSPTVKPLSPLSQPASYASSSTPLHLTIEALHCLGGGPIGEAHKSRPSPALENEVQTQTQWE